MKVKELIELLQYYREDKEVVIESGLGGYDADIALYEVNVKKNKTKITNSYISEITYEESYNNGDWDDDFEDVEVVVLY
jgi:hypothetical protein